MNLKVWTWVQISQKLIWVINSKLYNRLIFSMNTWHVHLKPHGDRWENGSFVEELWEEWICKCDCGQILRLVLRFPCILINPPTQLSLTSWCFPSRSGRVSSKGDGRSFLDIPKVSSVTGLCSKASPVFAAVKPVSAGGFTWFVLWSQSLHEVSPIFLCLLCPHSNVTS